VTEYTIAAIPTVYRGRRYRSRLEARWAAFFDLLGWQHEYEPFDLGKWSPDFLLFRDRKRQFFVEIKPIADFDVDVADRMWGAAQSSGDIGLLLLGVAPTKFGPDDDPMIDLGWRWWPGEETFEHALLIWVLDPDAPRFQADVLGVPTQPLPPDVPRFWWGASLDVGHLSERLMPSRYGEHSMDLWAKASNTVQWRPDA
jgi:hypothetical protein